ncbi:ASCH domain-containing protein [Ornithinimicrobium sp. Arc0846-15]|nr:ASCH domain-containing protein [Ornithinimicrobium laminariae]
MDNAEITAFWQVARRHARLEKVPVYGGPVPLELLQPAPVQFGDNPAQSDDLAELVVAGQKTLTSSAAWDYEAAGEPLPTPGTMNILVDGNDHPRALIVVRAVDVVPFDQVDEEHARAEGEGDGSLADWRRRHEEFFRSSAEHDRGFSETMPVVLERFELIYPKAAKAKSRSLV